MSVMYFFYVLSFIVFPFYHDRNLMMNYLITVVIFLLTFFEKNFNLFVVLGSCGSLLLRSWNYQCVELTTFGEMETSLTLSRTERHANLMRSF
jgi:hypothetical protein